MAEITFAGGCFWCMAKPYYEYKGVKRVLSGYTGGHVENPTYEQVKTGTTGHREAIKIEFDENEISFMKLMNIFFTSIDPFDDGGQFIDRGENYTTAVFTDDEKVREYFWKRVSLIEEKYGKKVAVKLLPESTFYVAEEYHQDYSIKNPELMKHEEETSGRTTFDFIKLD